MKSTLLITLFYLFLTGCATPPTAHPLPADGMIFIEGGVVTVGGYAVDETHWGDRETFIKSFFIDIEPTRVKFYGLQELHDKKRASSRRG